MKILLLMLLAYLIGAVPFAYVVGKLFYKVDVRQHGSGNLGGSNTGRVLGKKAGLAVMTLDLLKVSLVVFLAGKFSAQPWVVACAATAAAAGHCWPVFVRFKGGKAVATLYGFLFGLWVCESLSPLVFFLPLLCFLAVLFMFKIVSVSSITSSLAAAAYLWLSGADMSYAIAAIFFALLIILRHHENIRRLLAGNERKISWI